MMVLTRKPGEKIVLGENIILTVVEVKGNRVRLALEAPEEISIFRSELVANTQNDFSRDKLPAAWLKAETCEIS